MNLEIKEVTSPRDPAQYLVSVVLSKILEGKKVLLFLTGGSSVAVGSEISKMLAREDLSFDNLIITLTDERYGDVGHRDSNWQQLLDNGFNINGAKIIPVLQDKDLENTVKAFSKNLSDIFKEADFKIGLFGIGKDMHTAGILPESEAVECRELACGYDTPIFSRVTITKNVVDLLDEAVVFLQGENKKDVVKNLERESPPQIEPAQILKQVPKLTIFTNF